MVLGGTMFRRFAGCFAGTGDGVLKPSAPGKVPAANRTTAKSSTKLANLLSDEGRQMNADSLFRAALLIGPVPPAARRCFACRKSQGL